MKNSQTKHETPATGMEKSRLAALADGIFSVAMTLLVLDIKLPEGVHMGTDGELWQRLFELRDRFAVYAFSFVMLGIYWIGHHFHFHFMRRTNRPLLWLNLVFLFFVTLVPFSTALLGGHAELRLAVVAYGANLIMIAVMMYANMQYLLWNPRLSEKLTPTQAWHIQRRLILLILVPLAAMIISFINVHAALLVFLFMAPAFMVRGKIDADLE